nr:DUF4907 domain-containing protein [uncultured Dyadobacter sp.]
MIKRNLKILLIGVLAFAAAIYVLFFKGQRIIGNREGLSHFKVEAFKQPSGWGYRIRQDTTAVIEQKFIPGVAGTNGFTSEQQALSVGKLVKQKLDRGVFPPTITAAELDSLGIDH